MSDKTEKAKELFKQGYNCSQAVLAVFCEELGLDFSKETFIEYDSGCDGYDCYKMYFVNKDVVLEDIKIQEEELSEVRWFSMDELHHMVDNGELNNNQISCFIKVCEFLEQN